MEDMEIERKILKPYKYIPDTDVVVVQNKLIEEDLSDPVFKRMESLMRDCYKVTNMNAYFFQQDILTLSLYTIDTVIPDKVTVNYEEFKIKVEINPEYITSYAILAVNRNGGIVEVWNLCTSGKYKSLDYSGKILETLNINNPYE